MRKAAEQNITWFQINNLVPIIVSFITVALAWGSMRTELAVIETKLDTFTSIFKTIQDQQVTQNQQIVTLQIRQAADEAGQSAKLSH